MDEEQTNIIVRVPASLKKEIESIAKANDITVSQVLRALMRGYIANNKPAAEPAAAPKEKRTPAAKPAIQAGAKPAASQTTATKPKKGQKLASAAAFRRKGT